MKPTLTALLAWMAFNTTPVCGQGYLLYDQTSPRLDWPLRDGAEWNMKSPSGPPGQSLTPSMSRIDFIELWTGDGVPGNGLGARVYVILRSDSIKGPIIASTTPVFLEDGFAYGPAVDNNVKFFFPNPVPVILGTTYYFQPALEENSDVWWVLGYNSYQYPGGIAFWGTRHSRHWICGSGPGLSFLSRLPWRLDCSGLWLLHGPRWRAPIGAVRRGHSSASCIRRVGTDTIFSQVSE